MIESFFRSPSDLEKILFRIVDNGRATIDRYTVIFNDGNYLNLSEDPWSPGGVSMSGNDIDVMAIAKDVEDEKRIDLALGDLNPRIVEHIIARLNEEFNEIYNDVLSDLPEDIFDADINDGTYQSTGKGIYKAAGDYYIRSDNNADEPSEEGADGPFDSLREAILATIPDSYSLAGEEYHPNIDVCDMESNSQRLKSVHSLEQIVIEDDEESKNDEKIDLALAIYNDTLTHVDTNITSVKITDIENIVSIASELILNIRDGRQPKDALDLLEDALVKAKIIDEEKA